MDKNLTSEDLVQFRLELLADIREIISSAEKGESKEVEKEWVKGRAVRKRLDISPGSLQKLRIAGKLRHRKLMGSYYYHRQDLERLFDEQS